MLIELDAATFRSAVILADRPVLVAFHAGGCSPCQMQKPVLETLDHRFRGTADIFLVDAGQSPELASLFGVRSVPTAILFTGGKIARRFTGLTNGHDLIMAILACLEPSQTAPD